MLSIHIKYLLKSGRREEEERGRENVKEVEQMGVRKAPENRNCGWSWANLQAWQESSLQEAGLEKH